MNNRVQATSRKLGLQVCVALALLVAPATAGTAIWDGGSLVNTGWQTTTNWVGDTVPTFNNTLDVYFHAAGAGNLSNFLGTASTIRTLNFTGDADGDVSIRLANTLSGALARNLSLGGAGGAAITCDAGAGGNFTIGVGGTGCQLVLLENLAITHNGTGSLTINRPITGGYGLACNGSGVVWLTAANTYTGSTAVSGGAVVIGADSGLGAAPASATPGHLTLNSGGLASTATFALDANRGVALEGVGGQFNVNSGTLTVGGIIASTGGLEKAGAGALTLTNANTYAGGTLLSAGTLTINNDSGIGTGPFSISGGTVASSTGNTLTNAITINGDFTLTGNTGATVPVFTGPVSLGTAAGTSRTITESAANTGTGSPTFAGVISDGLTANKLIKAGAGGLQLNGANTFTGGVDLNGGALLLNDNQALGFGTLTLADGTLLSVSGLTARTLTNAVVVNGNFTWSLPGKAALTLAGPMDLGAATRTITVGSARTPSHTLSGVVSGSGGLTVIDTVTAASTNDLALTGVNTFTGDLTIGQTVNLAVNGDAAMGAGTNVIISQNGSLVPTASFATGKRITFTGLATAVTVGPGITLTANGVVGGSGASPNKDGSGTLVLNAANEFADSSVFLVKAGKLKLGNAAALNGTTLKFNPSGSSLDNTSGTGLVATGIMGLEMTTGFTFTGTDDLDLSAASSAFVQTASTTRTLNIAAKTLTIGGILATGTDYAGTPRVAGALNKSGDGTLVIKSGSDYTNGTTVAAGTLRLAAANALPPGGSVTLAGGTLDMGDFMATPSSLSVTANSSLVLGAGSLTFTNQTADAWAGRLAVSGELGRYTLCFQPALSAGQLAQIDYAGGGFYQSSDGHLRTFPRGTIFGVR